MGVQVRVHRHVSRHAHSHVHRQIRPSVGIDMSPSLIKVRRSRRVCLHACMSALPFFFAFSRHVPVSLHVCLPCMPAVSCVVCHHWQVTAEIEEAVFQRMGHGADVCACTHARACTFAHTCAQVVGFEEFRAAYEAALRTRRAEAVPELSALPCLLRVCLRACLRAHVRMYLRACMRACLHPCARVQVRMCMCLYASVCVCMHGCMCERGCVCPRVRVSAYTHALHMRAHSLHVLICSCACVYVCVRLPVRGCSCA